MTILDATHLFREALAAEPDRLHFAAHSHHLWPDATREAHQRAWLDAAQLADEKWDRIFSEVHPAAQANVARCLGVTEPARVAFSANTHDLLVRLMSALPGWSEDRPLRVISTDAEFHSFTRQMRRLVESGRVQWTTVPAEPFETLTERFQAASCAEEAFDLAFASHVFFSSSYVFEDAFRLLSALPNETACVVDGYHGFFAVETDLGPFEDRLYYMSGGYKYAMSGEGACFLVAPPGRELRPEFTGWFAGFDSLAEAQSSRVGYDQGAARFMGATFEPTPLYRFNAVCDMYASEGLTIASVDAHVRGLQDLFLERVSSGAAGPLRAEDLVPGRSHPRGHFLTFRREDAQSLQKAMAAARIITDARGDRLRFGFGLYHGTEAVEALAERLHRTLA